MGKIVIFSAPSGSGKTTIVRGALKKFPELVFSISATTREKRGVEKDGVDYFFITEDEFKKKIEQNEFVEWESFYGYYYGTLKSFINSKMENGKSVVLEVDVKGALKIKKEYPDAVAIFISPPSIEELKRRLRDRKTESDEDLQKRIERAEMEIGYQKYFDYVVVNDDLERAKKEVYEILNKELNTED
ncbi:Guanylate kinase [hydrothermal vent metagenome]|uniref:Guanylate kinase n=1 Tax=hydrothermal vent metagenome TaxID=652676 RepID=A0A3B1D373_9ZZZZ